MIYVDNFSLKYDIFVSQHFNIKIRLTLDESNIVGDDVRFVMLLKIILNMVFLFFSDVQGLNSVHSEALGRRYPLRTFFSLEEDRCLVSLVELYGQNWPKISKCMLGRSARQVNERWRNYLSPERSSAPFTPQEDEIIENKYKEIGPSWKEIAQSLPGRTGMGVKNRWHKLNEHLKRRASGKEMQSHAKKITPQEDAIIMKKYEELGPNWEMIAQSLPGRDAKAVRLRCSNLLAKHPKDWDQTMPPELQLKNLMN
jgi:cytochrome c551/c552